MVRSSPIYFRSTANLKGCSKETGQFKPKSLLTRLFGDEEEASFLFVGRPINLVLLILVFLYAGNRNRRTRGTSRRHACLSLKKLISFIQIEVNLCKSVTHTTVCHTAGLSSRNPLSV